MVRWIHRVRRDDPPPSRLARLLDDWSVLGAVLVDVDSGMALSSFQGRGGALDLELLGACHADLVRSAVDALGTLHPAGPPSELVLSHDATLHHLMRTVPDPHGGLLVLAVVVTGPARTVARMRRRMRRIEASTLVPRPVSARPAHSARPDEGRGPAVLPAARTPLDSPAADGAHPAVHTLPLVPVAYGRPAGAGPHPAGEPTWFTPGAAPPDVAAPRIP